MLRIGDNEAQIGDNGKKPIEPNEICRKFPESTRIGGKVSRIGGNMAQIGGNVLRNGGNYQRIGGNGNMPSPCCITSRGTH
ncbi:hypothetical protein QT711_17305 [Sporosarcina saromensis]|uniref:Uncharacterized protein n=1 Tax=Sporosarcina saromensis TaxID=359365 RepID=A0ABU4GF49_9BACL|nr:hypothetical protein [Sporosarcina saromensis]MDW0114940.1 hypothetical protein [Sporosarcina saromensis]